MKVARGKRNGDARTIKRNSTKAVRQQGERNVRQALVDCEHHVALDRQEAFAEVLRELSVPAEPVTRPAGWFPECGFDVGYGS